jgi:uncharacterized protein YbaP (TraB family)
MMFKAMASKIEVRVRERRAFIGGIASALALVASGSLKNVATAREMTPTWPVWKLRGGASTIYLLGETPPRPSPWHDARIEMLVPGCSVVWTETNQLYRASQKDLLEKFAINPKRSLSDCLNRADMARLQQAAAQCKVELADLEPYRPWCVASLLQESYYQASGANGASADKVLTAKAETSGVALRSEFPAKDDVFAWFGGMTPVEEVQFLRYTLDEIMAGPSGNARIYDDWAAGKTEMAAAEVERYSLAYPELAAKLTTQRNQNWIPRFKSMLDEPGTSLVIVGLYHMVGKDGLIALASRNGISVSRL